MVSWVFLRSRFDNSLQFKLSWRKIHCFESHHQFCKEYDLNIACFLSVTITNQIYLVIHFGLNLEGLVRISSNSFYEKFFPYMVISTQQTFCHIPLWICLVCFPRRYTFRLFLLPLTRAEGDLRYREQSFTDLIVAKDLLLFEKVKYQMESVFVHRNYPKPGRNTNLSVFLILGLSLNL